MNRNEIIKRASNKLVLKSLEYLVPIILKLDPKNLPQVLMKIKKEKGLDNGVVGDFIQKILLEKNKIHLKNPKFKPVILNFSKEHNILGLQFPYY